MRCCTIDTLWPEYGLDDFVISDPSAGPEECPLALIMGFQFSWPEHGLDDFGCL